MSKWQEIARIGTWTASNGKQVLLDKGRMLKIVETNNARNEKDQAPVVFGHPKTNGPAYGWGQRYRLNGEVLEARLAQIPAAVKELVDNGHYKKVSISMGKGDLIRHIGLLGAVPPAIKGLADIKFEENDDTVVIDFDFNEVEPDDSKPGDTPSKEDDDMAKTPKELELEAQLKKSEDARKKAEDDLKTKNKEFSEAQTSTAKKARVEKVDKLIEAGKVLPAEKNQVIAFAEQLGASENKVEFSEGDGEKSLETHYLESLEGREKHGLFDEFSAPKASGDSGEAVDTYSLTQKF